MSPVGERAWVNPCLIELGGGVGEPEVLGVTAC